MFLFKNQNKILKSNVYVNFKFIKKHFSSNQLKSAPILKDYLNKKDHMITGFFKDGSARFVFSDTSQTLQQAQKRFELYDPKKLEELGIAYNTSLILNSFLMGIERIKILCQYCQEINDDKSFITTIYSESIGTGEVRGFYEETKVENQELNRDTSSFLKISKILYNHKEEMYGIIKLTNSDKLTDQDIFKYFEESEQIRTHVYFNNKFDNKDYDLNLISQSLILQKMPDCDLIELENKFIKILNNRNFQEIKENGLSISLVNSLFKDLKFDVELRRTPIDFFCRCSKTQFKDVMSQMGKEEINDMIEQDQRSVQCKNCNKEYILTDEDFEDILNNIK